MTLDYTTKGKVDISIREYMDKMLAELPLGHEWSIQDTRCSIFIRCKCTSQKTPRRKMAVFPPSSAKLLHLCRRMRQDIQTFMAFLFTRLQSPDEDDY